MNLREEVIGDTLDSMLDGDEAEEDKVINQVLDEIGIETNAKVFFCAYNLANNRQKHLQLSKVPRVHDNIGETSKASSKKDDVDIDRLLAELKD